MIAAGLARECRDFCWSGYITLMGLPLIASCAGMSVAAATRQQQGATAGSTRGTHLAVRNQMLGLKTGEHNWDTD